MGNAQIKWTKELINSKNYAEMFKKIHGNEDTREKFEKYKSTVIESTKESYLTFLAENAAYSIANKLIQLVRIDSENRDPAERNLILSGSDSYTIANAIVRIKSDEEGNPASTNIKVYENIENQYKILTDEKTKSNELTK